MIHPKGNMNARTRFNYFNRQKHEASGTSRGDIFSNTFYSLSFYCNIFHLILLNI